MWGLKKSVTYWTDRDFLFHVDWLDFYWRSGTTNERWEKMSGGV